MHPVRYLSVTLEQTGQDLLIRELTRLGRFLLGEVLVRDSLTYV